MQHLSTEEYYEDVDCSQLPPLLLLQNCMTIVFIGIISL